MKSSAPALLPAVLPAALAVLLAAGPAVAQQVEPAQIFRAGDAGMSCIQISDEAAQLSAGMGGAQGGGVFRQALGVARSGATLLVPGASLALAGADALNRPERERREAEARAVEQRWYYLNGLYTGLQCGQEPEVAQAPVAVVAPAPASIATPSSPRPPVVIVASPRS